FSADPATVTKNAGTAFIIPAAPVPGDFDADHVVTINDYNTWKLAYGTTVTAFSGADGNGDGMVNAADYTVWRNHMPIAGMGQASNVDEAQFGETLAVPEPTALVLMLPAFMLLRRRRLRQA